MKLSIVIVNYNVSFFLEQCLRSVYTALSGIDAEVFVVDNNSQDNSLAMLQEKFPKVHLIANADNPGFSKANNQALRLAKGAYVLLLNPDTVVEEQTFQKALDFMDLHPEGGGLGIRMIDGRGRYLPESKRGIPSPWTAFYKICGLSKLFPRSKKYARYYLGHLDPQKNQEIEILAGAFMLMRRSALEKVGLLDEDFFMYGEDIDLSYRLLQAGYKNYYLADSRIIHYKGESTKKGSLNYVFVFYKAMIIFARKHFRSGRARLFATLIHLAIYLRAALSVMDRLLRKIAQPLADLLLLFGGLNYIKLYWEQNHRFIQGGTYPDALVYWAFPSYILVWLLALFFNGVYDDRPRLAQIFKGVFTGTLAILVVYSLLPEDFRFSRAIIVLGAFWAALILPLWRYALQKITGWPLLKARKRQKRVLIVGSGEEALRVKQLIAQSGQEIGFTGTVEAQDEAAPSKQSLGKLSDLRDICSMFSIDEVIFCSKQISGQEIFAQMSHLQSHQLEIKIAPPESQFIIGSNSIHAQGQWYAMSFKAISAPANRRSKRLLDLSLALLLLLAYPLALWFSQSATGLLRNCWLVLMGQKTWVGYDQRGQLSALPKLLPGVIAVSIELDRNQPAENLVDQLNQLYAKDYQWQGDLRLIFRHFRQLGRQA